MTKFRYLFPLLLCLCLTSCAPVVFLGGAAAGVGGYKYYKGAMTVIYEASYQDTWDASLETLEDMGLNIETKTEKLGSGTITARTPENETVKLNLAYVASNETEVTIRVGVFGDENASSVIKDNIQNKLF